MSSIREILYLISFITASAPLPPVHFTHHIILHEKDKTYLGLKSLPNLRALFSETFSKMNSTTGVPTIGVRCTCLVVMLTYDICLAVTRINCHYMAGPHYLLTLLRHLYMLRRVVPLVLLTVGIYRFRTSVGSASRFTIKLILKSVRLARRISSLQPEFKSRSS